MAKGPKRKKAVKENASPPASASKGSQFKSIFRLLISYAWLPLLLAAVAFLVYLPSLGSALVYDARAEVLEEGSINLSDILSLKVLSLHLILGDRPGQLLYLMLNGAIWGKEPWGYHLGSNLIHAANVALLFMLLRRLIATEPIGADANNGRKSQLAGVAVTLLFALHPITAETVADISYSSDLLVTFFTLLSLLAAISFRAENIRATLLMGGVGTLCAFAAVTCKESGIAVPFLLIVYWLLFRRDESKGPWLWFLGAATTVTAAFLAARFLFAPPNHDHLSYLGGSFFHVFVIQPRLWVFMMGQLLWPIRLSADYTLENISGLSTSLSLAILIVVLSLQGWLATKSRIGGLGVAMYWLGLAAVSNFMPLYRILGDRFYYLPLAGVAMQLLSIFMILLTNRIEFWLLAAPYIIAFPFLLLLTFSREDVFASELSLWSDTVKVSPLSYTAHNNLGVALFGNGQVDAATVQYQKALEINPHDAFAQTNLGQAFSQKGLLDEAITNYQTALEIDPNLALAHNNLGNALLQKGRVDEAMIELQKALEISPELAEAHDNLGNALSQKGQVDEAIGEYQKALENNPNYGEAHYNLGNALLQKGRVDEAMIECQKAVEIQPTFALAHNNLGIAFFQKGQLGEAIGQFQEAIRLKPDCTPAQNNLAKVEAMIRQRTDQK